MVLVKMLTEDEPPVRESARRSTSVNALVCIDGPPLSRSHILLSSALY